MPKDLERGRVSPQQRPLTVSGKKKGVLCGSEVNSGASSESGESHEIKFTQKEGCTPCTCACVFLAISFVAIGSAAGIYFGLQFLSQKPVTDRVFKGKFVILEGDKFTEELMDPNSSEFETKSELYRLKLDSLYNNSIVKDSYHHSEIITFEKDNAKKLLVHFNLHIVPDNKRELDTGDLYFVLSEEVMRNQAGVFGALKIDQQSLHIQERKPSSETINDPWVPRRQYPGSLVGLTTKSPSDGPRKCGAITLDFCQNLNYNSTSFPNVVGHRNLEEVNKEAISYRQMIDFECYALAQELICSLLQPSCIDDKMIPPCRSFCQDFQNSCSKLFPKEVEEKINCSSLPDSKDDRICTPKPDCAEELRTRGKSNLLCDGVLDCPDYSDEMNCDFCKPTDFYCGSRQCVSFSKRCDLTKDCRNGADERGCLYLGGTSNSTEPEQNASQFRFYQKEGFVMSVGAGSANQSKVCLENQNSTLSLARREIMLRHLATSACSQLHYRTAEMVETRYDSETSSNYTKMVEPLTSPVTFQQSDCDSKQPIFVKCNGLECGKRPASMQSSHSIRSRPDSVQDAAHGDWPWLAALTTEDQLKCDAVLLNAHWLIASSECLRTGVKSSWTVELGKVRLGTVSPFDQKRTVSRVIQSPDSHSRMSLLKLDHPVNSSDFVRPACLPGDRTVLEGTICYALTWDMKTHSLLQIQMRIKPMKDCTNNSSAPSGICAKPTGILTHHTCKDDSPTALFCELDFKWSVLGYSSDTLCGQSSNPHFFTKVSTQAQWISHIISTVNEA